MYTHIHAYVQNAYTNARIHTYVCVNTYIYAWTQHMHIFTHAYTQTCTSMHTCACTRADTHVHMHTHYIYMCEHTYMHEHNRCMYTHICMYTHVYVCMHTHIYMNAHTISTTENRDMPQKTKKLQWFQFSASWNCFSFNTKSFCNKSADIIFSQSCTLLAQSSAPTRRSFTEKGRSPGSTSRCLPPPSCLSPLAAEVTAHEVSTGRPCPCVGAIMSASALGQKRFPAAGSEMQTQVHLPSIWALPLEKPLGSHSLPFVLKPNFSHFKRRSVPKWNFHFPRAFSVLFLAEKAPHVHTWRQWPQQR